MSKTPFGMQSAVQNSGKVKFDPPKVPVIFILGEKSHVKNTFEHPYGHFVDILESRRTFIIDLCFVSISGGPGSGKVTHCDTIMQERRGLVHINMMDLLQQYAIGNGKGGSSSCHYNRDVKPTNTEINHRQRTTLINFLYVTCGKV